MLKYNNKSYHIPLRLLEVLQEFTELGWDFNISGSLSLLCQGLLDRPVKDLDLVVTSFEPMEAWRKNNNKSWVKYSESVCEIPGEVPEDIYMGFTYRGLKIDLFLKEELEDSKEVQVSDGIYKCSNADYIIAAKIEFINKFYTKGIASGLCKDRLKTLRKHTQDLEEIFRRRGDLMAASNKVPADKLPFQ